MRSLAPAACLLAVAVIVAGCGEEPKAKPVSKPVATIWSSLPHRGPQRDQALLIERAIRGAIFDLRGLQRGYRVRYVPLDDSSAAANGWDPAIVAANARRASTNRTTVAYIGEYDSGATAVALPILNQLGILQTSPASTAEGLTMPGVGAGPGAPFQYYPSGRRTLARLVARDSLQGAVLASLARRDGCKRLGIADDGSTYGAGLSAIAASEAGPRGLRVRLAGTLDPRAETYRRQLRRVRGGCLLYSGQPGSTAVKVVDDLARRNPRSRIYLPDALAARAFVDPTRGGLRASTARRVTITVPIGPLGSQPPLGQRILRRIGGLPGDVRSPYVASAYAATELALRCLHSAYAETRLDPVRTGETRRALVACAVGRGHRSAAVGDYRVGRKGDWSQRAYSRFRIDRGRVVFAGAVKTPKLVASPTPNDQASG